LSQKTSFLPFTRVFLFSQKKKSFMSFRVSFFIATIVAFASCNNAGNKASHGAIVLGDSSTIIYERDSQYLRDFVADIHLQQPAPPPEDTITAEAATISTPENDTSQPRIVEHTTQPATTAAVPQGAGLSIDFEDFKVFIPNISARSFSKNPVNKNGASFQLTAGQLNGNQVKISGATVQKISQRYQTSVVLKNSSVNAVLSPLNYTSAWETLKGNGATFYITGLDDRQLKYTTASSAQIMAALKNALRGKRYSNKKEREILAALNGVNSVTQAPLKVVLRTVIWQIEGKGKDGQAFKKELRLDMII
jgi:hypothetical protein